MASVQQWRDAIDVPSPGSIPSWSKHSDSLITAALHHLSDRFMSSIVFDDMDHYLATVAKRYISRRHPFIVWLDSPRRYLEEPEQILGTCHDWAYFRISIRISSASSLHPFLPRILQNHSITHGQSWSYLSASYTGPDQTPVNKASNSMSKFQIKTSSKNSKDKNIEKYVGAECGLGPEPNRLTSGTKANQTNRGVADRLLKT